MKIKNILLGSDPELFIKNNLNQITTPLYIVNGDKTFPAPLSVDGFFIQRDNMALEFCIPPAESVYEFVKNIDLGMYLSVESLPEGYDVAPIPSIVFPKELIDNDIDAQVFGCDPDFSAYTNSVNAKPKAKNKYLRSSGGQ